MLPIAVLMMFALGACARFGAAPSDAPAPSTSANPQYPDGPPADEAAAQVIQAYGEAQPEEFAGVYLDSENGGRLVARFTDHLDLHQGALDSLLGGPGRVLVLDADFTEAELAAIVASIDHEQLAKDGIVLVMAGTDVTHNRVEIVAKSDEPDAERTLQAYGPPGAIEVDLYPADQPWTQPVEGPGWRLLGVFDTELPYTVAIALDDPQLAIEWERYGLPGEPPAWDPAAEVVIFLTDGIGSTCTELRLDAIVFDADAQVVHSELSDPYQPRGCTADLAGGKTFVVAVDRNQLPPSPFRLQIHAELMPCDPNCGSGPTSMVVDLRR
jgi:hypothetical protein